LGDFADAKQQEEKAISINPTDANAYLNLGVDLFQLGSVDTAVENLLHAIELDPSQTPAYFDLAASYKEMGHIDSAAAIYRKILELAPTIRRLFRNCAQSRNDTNKSRNSALRIVSIMPDEGNARELVSKVETVSCPLTRSPIPRIVRRAVTDKILIVRHRRW
jgi:tetratricopeptide (TPR) repeat protein